MKPINNSLSIDLLEPNRFYISLLLTLTFLDLFFIIASWLNYNTDLITNDSFDITKDFGYAEIFQYCKELAIAVLLFKVLNLTSPLSIGS
ncbi:MAG: hypothetical protein V4570_08610 [Pseudomonadota bacterium]